MITTFMAGQKIFLRGLTNEDCREGYLQFVNDAASLSYVDGIGYHPLSIRDLEEYIAANSNRNNLLLGIFECHTNVHVGNIHLGQIKQYHRNCIFGIVMDRNYQGKGYAREASCLIIKHAFEVMNMYRIQIPVVDDNHRAVRLYEGLGATLEGRCRAAFYYSNVYHDVLMYSILKPEYYGRLNNDAVSKRKG